MKIVSYNVNGIRAALQKDLLGWLRMEAPDILCIQETKAQDDQIPFALFEELGYKYHYSHSAEKRGYSGVAIMSKIAPERVVVGMCNDRYDREGRVLRADFQDLTVVDVYVPSGTTGDIRQEFKMDFLDAFSGYLQQLRQERTDIVLCGDFNICHKPIDINHPERQVGVSGFLPEEREWLDKLSQSGWIDSFREFCLLPAQYSWWSYRFRSRERNAGWRIDYHWVTDGVRVRLRDALILSEAVHSDHCPVEIILEDR